MDSQKFCLKWNNYQNSVTSVFENLRQDEELVDMTLCCEGHKIKAHRMMLSACSPYFRDLLKENPCQHPVFFLKDTSYPDLKAVVEFVYKGEVNVAQSQLGSFLKTAEMLQVRGLTGDEDEEPATHSLNQSSKPSTPRGPGRPAVNSTPQPHLNSGLSSRLRPASPPQKRRRLSDSPDRTGATPSGPPSVSAASPGVSLPAALPPPAVAQPLPPMSLSAPPPPAVSSAITAHSELTSRSGAAGTEPPASPAMEDPRTPQHHHHPATPGMHSRDYGIKVEKVDLADEDEESLEATFSHVSNFEGSDHSAGSHDMSGLLSRVSDQGMADMSAMAGPSEDGGSQGWNSTRQRRVSPVGRQVSPGRPPGNLSGRATSAAAAAAEFQCNICGHVLGSEASLRNHRSIHRGNTRCGVCGTVYSTISAVRRHMRMAHPDMPQQAPVRHGYGIAAAAVVSAASTSAAAAGQSRQPPQSPQSANGEPVA